MNVYTLAIINASDGVRVPFDRLLFTPVRWFVGLQRFHKKAAAFVLRAVSKHSPELSQAVVASGGVDALVLCLDEFDPGVREATAWALCNIAQHNACKDCFRLLSSSAPTPLCLPHVSSRPRHRAALSQSVVDAGAVPLLVLCLVEPEIALKRIAASTLSNICKHTPELAQIAVDCGAIAHLAQMILDPDAKLKVRPRR